MTRSATRLLQLTVAVAALVPVLGGGFEVIHGLAGAGTWTDNHERYLSGLLMAIGFGFWTTVSDIERKTGRFRLLTALVVVGGLSRLLGLALGDRLSAMVVAALVMELGVTPLLCLWQSRCSDASARFLRPAI
jgi:Domain of unknown function (DUF4345)